MPPRYTVGLETLHQTGWQHYHGIVWHLDQLGCGVGTNIKEISDIFRCCCVAFTLLWRSLYMWLCSDWAWWLSQDYYWWLTLQDYFAMFWPWYASVGNFLLWTENSYVENKCVLSHVEKCMYVVIYRTKHTSVLSLIHI